MTGLDISKDFFENGECCLEAEIESEILHAIKSVVPYCKIRKSKMGQGFTDGVIKLYDSEHNYLGFIINETKRDKTFDQIGLKAFSQLMLYAGNFLYDVSFDPEINSSKFIGFFITTAYDFCFIPAKYLQESIKTFYPIWNEVQHMAPHKAYTKLVVIIWLKKQRFKFYLYKLDENFILEDLFNDIYKKNY